MDHTHLEHTAPSEPGVVDRQPLRVSGWAAIVLGSALTGAFLWSTGADVRQIVGALSLQLIATLPGLEWAHNRVTPVASPSLPTVDAPAGEQGDPVEWLP